MTAELLREEFDLNLDWSSPEALNLPRVDVSRIAEDVAEMLEYRPGGALEPIVQSLGGRIEYVDVSENDANYGSIRISPDGFLISLPLDSGPMRDRFTLAHEIGHYVLHYLYQNNVHAAGITHLKANRYGSDQAEWEANWFAAAFLMPGAAFRAAFEELDQDLLAVSDFFKVSQSAAAVRAKSLRILA